MLVSRDLRQSRLHGTGERRIVHGRRPVAEHGNDIRLAEAQVLHEAFLHLKRIAARVVEAARDEVVRRPRAVRQTREDHGERARQRHEPQLDS
jgi:hypothetical protein